MKLWFKKKEQKEITIDGDLCFRCGTNKKITRHHAIPSHLKPKRNVTVPVCRKCHDKIHFDDVSGMYSYIHKIEKTLKTCSINLGVLKNQVNENTNLKRRVEKEESLISKMKKGKKITLGEK